MAMEIRASEGETHWYKKEDGSPFYTIIGSNGKERNVTLRDAKKLGNIVPSVTTMTQLAAKKGLDLWKQEQLLLAALTLPRFDGEPENVWLSRVREDAKETARKAAERGKKIHGWIQQGFEGKLKFSEKDEAWQCYKKAKEEVQKCGLRFFQFFCEKSFATGRYGGKVDLHTPEIVIDIKTKDTPLDDIKTWDEHDQQIAAYREGLGYPNARGAILFVSTKDISAKLVWIEEEKLQRGMKMFNALLDYFYAKSGL